MITSPVHSVASGGGESLFAPAGGELGKEEFLQLLVAQLRNQDPMNPMDGQDMAAQLAQFTSVEQLINLNEQMAVQAAYSEALAHGFSTSTAMGVLGRTVVARTDQVAISSGSASPVTVEVGTGGGKATLRVYDAGGNEVASRELGSLSAGRHTLELGRAADSLNDGVYTVRVEVTGADGADVPATTYSVLRIDGVRYGEHGVILAAGPIELKLQDVQEVLAQPQTEEVQP